VKPEVKTEAQASAPVRAPPRTPTPAPRPVESKPTVVASVRPPAPAPTPAPAPAPEPVKKKPHRANGTLQLNAYPWAKVRVQGRDRGITPLRLELPAGDYAIELENPVVSVKRTIMLTVREGQETTHFEKLTP
jgi:serine/threonine-protein kinase